MLTDNLIKIDIAFSDSHCVSFESDSGEKIPRFEMVAYTGAPMRIAGFDLPVIVDLKGVVPASQSLPIRLDHDARKGVGHTTTIAINLDDNKIFAIGIFSRDTPFAKDVLSSAQKGFPWQASIGGSVEDAKRLERGETCEVNGRMVSGPVWVVNSLTLREISFVDNGGDHNTSVIVDCNEQERTEMNEEKTIVENETQVAENIECKEKEVVANEQTLSLGETIADFRKGFAAEKKRVAEIEKIGNRENPELEAAAIAQGWTPEKFELEFLRASRPKTPAIHTENHETNADALEAAALLASGVPQSRLEKQFDDRTLTAGSKLRGIGLQEFAELACGKSLPRFRSDSVGWLQAAFSNSSLSGILSNIANKTLLEGYNYVEDAWRQICKIASVNDFKQHERYRLNGAFQFEKVGPGGELKHGQIDEQTITQKAETHGIMFALTRQMIIDDDLGALNDIPRQIGIGAAEAIAEAVWTLLLSNPVQGDNKAFFHANHNNLLAGTTTNLSVDSLTAAEIKFGEQTKPNGKPLGLMPSLLLVPMALKVTAETLMRSIDLNETTVTGNAKPSTNPHAGKYNVVSSAYLGNALFTGNSTKAWYLFADPNRLPAFEVAFLGGMDRPIVERADADFNTLGVQFRGYLDFGVKEQDYRGALKIKGEA